MSRVISACFFGWQRRFRPIYCLDFLSQIPKVITIHEKGYFGIFLVSKEGRCNLSGTSLTKQKVSELFSQQTARQKRVGSHSDVDCLFEIHNISSELEKRTWYLFSSTRCSLVFKSFSCHHNIRSSSFCHTLTFIIAFEEQIHEKLLWMRNILQAQGTNRRRYWWLWSPVSEHLWLHIEICSITGHHKRVINDLWKVITRVLTYVQTLFIIVCKWTLIYKSMNIHMHMNISMNFWSVPCTSLMLLYCPWSVRRRLVHRCSRWNQRFLRSMEEIWKSSLGRPVQFEYWIMRERIPRGARSGGENSGKERRHLPRTESEVPRMNSFSRILHIFLDEQSYFHAQCFTFISIFTVQEHLNFEFLNWIIFSSLTHIYFKKLQQMKPL